MWRNLLRRDATDARRPDEVVQYGGEVVRRDHAAGLRGERKLGVAPTLRRRCPLGVLAASMRGKIPATSAEKAVAFDDRFPGCHRLDLNGSRRRSAPAEAVGPGKDRRG